MVGNIKEYGPFGTGCEKCSPPPASVRKSTSHSVRPRLEVLEDRLLLATLMVMNGNDSGADSLRQVLSTAASNSVIQFAAGVTTVNLLTPIQIGIGANGKPNGVTNLTIDGQSNVTINGQTKTSLFEVGAGSDTLQNLTLTAGNGTDGKNTNLNGGAVRVDSGATLNVICDTFKANNTIASSGKNGGAIENDGNLNVTGCTFTTNTADGYGGAIENTGTTKIIGAASTFTGNQSAKQNGGAIDSAGSGSLNIAGANFYDNLAANGSGGAVSTATNTKLNNDTFGATGLNQDNQAEGGDGGAVYAYNSGPNNLTLTVLACKFVKNIDKNDFGGALAAQNFNTDVEQSTFDQNQAASGDGGAVYLRDTGGNGPKTIAHTFNLDIFTGNQAQNGGALKARDSASASAVNLSLSNSTFSNNNKAVSNNTGTGGGVYINDTLSGTGSATNTLTNDTFFQNASDNTGGALSLNLANSGAGNLSAVLTSLTVNGNTAANDGGGLYYTSSLQAVTLDNNILDGNTVTNKPAGAQDVTLAGGAKFKAEKYNLLGVTDNNNFTNGVNNDILNNTTGLANQLAVNGAPANYPQTLALTAVKNNTSPGYETGDPNLATSVAPLNQDERGKTRQVNKVSIGAEDPDAIYAAAVNVGSSADPALPGQAVTFTAAVTSVGGIPTGTVAFYDGSTELGTATLDGNGNATLTTWELGLGANDIIAVYSGDSTYANSAATLTQQVVQAGSTTSLSSSANPSPLGQPVTFTVTLGALDPNAGTPSGTVNFYDGTTLLGTATLSVVNGQVQATFTTAALGLGTHDIIAVYSGDSIFANSATSLDETIAS
jgi:predicted outer membrane repeat protein